MAPGSNRDTGTLPDPSALSLAAEEPIPVVLVTGFLGSGKTTLIRRLLQLPGLHDTAVIVNEFGEVGLDHELVETAEEDTVLLAGGCICCAQRGDLVRALRTLLDRRERGQLPPYRRVIVETSGLADPVPLLQTFMTDPLRLSRYRLRGLVAVIDGVSGLRTLHQHALAQRQVALADRLFISKRDLVDEAAELLRQAGIGEAAGRLPQWLPADDGLAAALLDWDEATEAAGDLPDHIHAAHEYQAEHAEFPQPVSCAEITRWLSATVEEEGDRILRLKGLLVTPEGDTVAVDAVQHQSGLPRNLGRTARTVGQVVIVTTADSRVGTRVLERLRGA